MPTREIAQTLKWSEDDVLDFETRNGVTPSPTQRQKLKPLFEAYEGHAP